MLELRCSCNKLLLKYNEEKMEVKPNGNGDIALYCTKCKKEKKYHIVSK